MDDSIRPMTSDRRKKILELACACFCLACLLGGVARAQSLDLSTDEAVLAELQKRVDAKRAELGKPGGSRLSAQSVCIKRLKESAHVIVIGFFRRDYGCHFEGAFVNSRYFEATDAALSRNALAALGWEAANQKEREQLVRVWVEKGLLGFFDVLYTKDEDLNAREFQPPYVVSMENGGIKITLWIRLPPRMRREKGYQHLEYRFAGNGDLSGSSTLENLLL